MNAPRKQDGGGKAKRSKNRNKNPRNRSLGKDFWGESAELPAVEDKIRITSDPGAVIRSLGRAPLGGQETIAEHYFRAVSDRVVALASALAAAGDLIEPEELQSD